MKEMIIVSLENNKKVKVVINTSLTELLRIMGNHEYIIGATVDGEICELNTRLKNNCTVSFFDFQKGYGKYMYRNGLKFIYINALKKVFSESVNVKMAHSLDKGIYTVINTTKKINKRTINKIKLEMKKIVDANLTIEKVSALRKSAIEYFKEEKYDEKVDVYNHLNTDFVTLYELEGNYNYFYGHMPVSTGYMKYFDITQIEEKAILLQFPNNSGTKVPEYTPRNKILGVFKEYNKKIKDLNVQYVSDINKIVASNKIGEFIKIDEIIHNERISAIANKISYNKSLKVVLVGGPSSSGKTTTSKKLGLYLKSKGVNSLILSTDDYFLERFETPKDENGKYNYEGIDALDVKLFNKQLNDLIAGKEVVMPKYNFITGEKEFKNKAIKLGEKDIIIIEGLHTMNDKLTSSIDRSKKFKIYASPFTPLAIDRHNHISTVDVRLLRRIVRDNATRGYSADQTLTSWSKVRKGEEMYVFPFQNDADIVYNSAMIYELGVLKIYAEPLLSSIESTSPNYETARRLVNFLKLFFPVSENEVPDTSILKEFVGKSYFE